MQISSVQAGQQLQQLQQTAKVQGSASGEANESASEKATELQKKAVAQRSGLGVNLIANAAF
ncbi:hypothetical protein O9H85_03750 [Paenibacillus filicis]|uniref:Uncharacterized protein n=1 Tax=Paenibacillus gyeongsangnamensis TaxID=3388067 RepID=A0ABT4Q402_9BACL|nr:hypothetical protein [Paenibacillus filicis]MCZ8511561.1 hypothetical protein [Paenibacillus filicis]